MNNKIYWTRIYEESKATKVRSFNCMLEGNDRQCVVEFANTLGMRGVFNVDKKLQLGKKSTVRLIEEVIMPILSNNGKTNEIAEALIKLREIQKDRTPKYRCDFMDCEKIIYKAFVGDLASGLYVQVASSMDYIRATLKSNKSKAQINKLN